LAGAEYPRAHRPTHGLLQPASLGGEATEFLGQAGFFLTDPLGVILQPSQEFGTDLVQGLASVAESGVVGGHDEFADGGVVGLVDDCSAAGRIVCGECAPVGRGVGATGATLGDGDLPASTIKMGEHSQQTTQ